MTARRRRRSGSGPSATALIAWAGGAKVIADHAANRAVHGAPASVSALVADDSEPLSGRFRVLALGSLIACGSVLAVTVHAGDTAFGPIEDQAGPGQNPAGSFAANPAEAPVPLAGPEPAPVPVAVHTAAAPELPAAGPLGGQLVRAGAVPRNTPIAVDGYQAAHSRPQVGRHWNASDSSDAQAAQQPAADPVQRALAPLATAPKDAVDTARSLAAPVLPSGFAKRSASAPTQRLVSSVTSVAPLDEATQPAMSMLSGIGGAAGLS